MSSVTMLRIMKVGIFIVLTMMFLITPHSTSQAATTGKIVGKVTDSSSGEPIANASIVLSGKQWGTASDLDGNYAILNLPPALYGVQVSSLGFHTLDIKDVYIASDLTTELNIKLTPNVLELKEAVIIFEPPQIELGGSSQKKRFDKATLEALQPASVTELISVTKGFKVDEEDKWHVRGSRSGDVAVIVEGVDLRDPLVDTQFSFNLSSEAIDEVNVLTGGFAAEYGRVMGGIVQITTSEGKSDNYSGRIEIETDRVIDTYSFDADNVQLAVGGPVPFTKFGDKNPMTFYLTGMTKLTNTYVPFNVQREANDYLKFGINLPERQNNEFQSSLKLAYNLNPSKKLTLYLTEAFRMWDIYPSGEGNISGNYGYGYKHNIDNRPYASNQSFTSNLTYTDQLSSKTFYEVKLVVFRTHSKVQPRGKTPGDFTMLDDIEDDFAIAADRNLNKYLERDEYLDSDGDGFMDGFMDANANGIFDGGGEGYEDLNYNGRWDRGEDWVDLNGNGVYDSAEPWIDVVNPLTGENNLGYFDSWDTYTDLNENGRWDPSEPQLPEQDWNGNGRWDGERFIDAGDKDKKYTPWEAWEDDNNNYLWDPGEVFTDVNGNGVFDYSEGYDDVNKNGKIDKRDLAQTGTGGMFDPDEPFIDGDFWWDTGEPFIDEPDPIHGVYNGRWDPGEVWFDLPSSSNQQTGAGLWFIGTERSLNGQYDPPNGMFDEYELFTRPTDWNFNSDRTRPVLYNFREELRGSDWPSNIFDVLYFEDGITPRSTWINRTIHDTNAPTFDMRNFNVEEDKEWYLDYNNNGEWNRDDGFLNPGIWDPNAFWQDRISTEYTGKFDLQSQVTEFHEMKVGFEIRYRMLEMQTIQQPDKAYSGEAILPDGSPWPERGGDRDFYEYNPFEGALYLQDKMEFDGLIVNAGIRGDFIIHDQKVVDEFRERVENDEPGAIYANRGTFRLSPRLGISHPITEQSKLYFNYGHFYQAPRFEYYYKSATANFDANSVIGNPNLEYEKTVQYELGVNTQISENLIIDISGYYKDQYDMISTQDERWKNLSIDRYANIDYGRMRGFEMSLEKRPSNHYSFTFNYDFSFAHGKASSQHEAQEARLSNVPYNYDEHPLNWDETHKINAYMTIHYNKGEHLRLLGMEFPDDWQLTLQWDFGSGLPYTPSTYTTGIDDKNLILPNSARKPWHESTTLKFEKFYTLNVMKLKPGQRGNQLIIGMTVRNLFNKSNISSVHAQTGSPIVSVHPLNPAYNPNSNDEEYDANPRNFGSGRNVFFKVGLSF